VKPAVAGIITSRALAGRLAEAACITSTCWPERNALKQRRGSPFTTTDAGDGLATRVATRPKTALFGPHSATLRTSSRAAHSDTKGGGKRPADQRRAFLSWAGRAMLCCPSVIFGSIPTKGTWPRKSRQRSSLAGPSLRPRASSELSANWLIKGAYIGWQPENKASRPGVVRDSFSATGFAAGGSHARRGRAVG